MPSGEDTHEVSVDAVTENTDGERSQQGCQLGDSPTVADDDSGQRFGGSSESGRSDRRGHDHRTHTLGGRSGRRRMVGTLVQGGEPRKGAGGDRETENRPGQEKERPAEHEDQGASLSAIDVAPSDGRRVADPLNPDDHGTTPGQRSGLARSPLGKLKRWLDDEPGPDKCGDLDRQERDHAQRGPAGEHDELRIGQCDQRAAVVACHLGVHEVAGDDHQAGHCWSHGWSEEAMVRLQRPLGHDGDAVDGDLQQEDPEHVVRHRRAPSGPHPEPEPSSTWTTQVEATYMNAVIGTSSISVHPCRAATMARTRVGSDSRAPATRGTTRATRAPPTTSS